MTKMNQKLPRAEYVEGTELFPSEYEEAKRHGLIHYEYKHALKLGLSASKYKEKIMAYYGVNNMKDVRFIRECGVRTMEEAIKHYNFMTYGTTDIEKAREISDAESHAGDHMHMCQITSLIESGKIVARGDLAAAIRDKRPEIEIPQVVLNYIADILAGQPKRGRPTSLVEDPIAVWRDDSIVEDFFFDKGYFYDEADAKPLPKKYEARIEAMANRYCVSEKTIERIITEYRKNNPKNI